MNLQSQSGDTITPPNSETSTETSQPELSEHFEAPVFPEQVVVSWMGWYQRVHAESLRLRGVHIRRFFNRAGIALVASGAALFMPNIWLAVLAVLVAAVALFKAGQEDRTVQLTDKMVKDYEEVIKNGMPKV